MQMEQLQRTPEVISPLSNRKRTAPQWRLARGGGVRGAPVLEARPHAVVHQQIDGGLHLARDVRDEERPQRMVLREPMLERLGEARRGERCADERDADRLELRGRERLRGEARPEAVPIAGERDEPGDAAVAHVVVDLGPLDVRRPVIAAAEGGVSMALSR